MRFYYHIMMYHCANDYEKKRLDLEGVDGSMENKMYFAVIGDIVNSKKIVNRSEVQTKMNRTLKTINRVYSDDIASNLIMTFGDEFQGLLSSGDNIMEILREIESTMHPVNFRIAIGYGSISTAIHKNKSLESDGAAYHCAREAIDLLRENEDKKSKAYKNKRLMVENKTVDSLLLESVNSLFTVLSSVEKSWTRSQREIIKSMMEEDNQVVVAEIRGLNQSTISRSLNSSQYFLYIELLNTVNRILSEI